MIVKHTGTGIKSTPTSQGIKWIQPGVNEFPDELWPEIERNCKKHLASGLFVKIVKKEIVEKDSPEIPVVTEEDLKDVMSLPFIEVTNALKELGLWEELSEEKKKEEGGNKTLTKKWLSEKLASDSDLAESVIEKLDEMRKANPETVEIEVSRTIKDMTSEEAEELIRNTYDVKLLKKWKADESRESVRAALFNQIEEMEKEPIKK
jgi:hypothetical protein